jgi:hypothetical protein
MLGLRKFAEDCSLIERLRPQFQPDCTPLRKGNGIGTEGHFPILTIQRFNDLTASFSSAPTC